MSSTPGTASAGATLRRRVLAILTSTALLMSVLATVAPGVASAGIATFSMELIGGERTVSSGEYVQYRFSFACSGLDTSCGATDISDDLDSNFDFIDVTVAAGWTGSYDSGTHRVTVSHTDFLDGVAAEATITARVKFGTAGSVSIPNYGTITYATPSGGASGTEVSSTYSVTTSAPTANWTVAKSKFSPSGNPAPDGNVVYTVSICATTGLANVDLLSASLTDTMPANTTVTDAGGGTVSGSTVTWALGDLLISTLYAGTDGTGQRCTNRSLTLNFPTASFPSGTVALNTVEGFGDTGGGVVSIGTANLNVTIIDPVQDVNVTKSGTSENIPGGRLSYTFRWNALGSNVNVENMVLRDTLPTSLDLYDVRAGTWTPSTIKADVEYSTDGTNWTNIGTVDGTANTTWTVSGGDIPSNATDIRWVFFDDTGASTVYEVPPAFNEGTRPRIRMDVPSGFTTPGTVQNCLDLTYDGSSTDQDCSTASIIDPIPRLDVAKQLITGGDLSPGDEIQWEVRIRNTGYLDLTDPTIADLLPSELEYVTWDSVTFDSSSATTPSSTKPNIEVIDNYNGTGRTLLRWTWTDSPPSGSYAVGGGSAAANGIELNPTNKWVRMRFTTRIVAGTSTGGYANAAVGFEVTEPECSNSGETGTDTGDLDGDSNTTETICEDSTGWSVIPAAVVSSQAWVSADAGLDHVDPDAPTIFPNPICPDLDGATRYPCSARTGPGGTFTYHLLLENSGNIPLTDYVVYDVLPYRGDTGITQILSGVSRNSEWIPDLEGPIVAADAFTATVSVTIEYSESTNPCRPELSSSSDETGWQSSCDNDWTSSPSDYTLVRAFRILAPFSSTDWGATEQLKYDVPMRAPFGAEYDSVAWNSMAHRVTNASTSSRLGASEPRAVGIMVPSASLAVVDSFDLALRKQITDQTADPIVSGSKVTYTIEVFNQGTVDATNVVVTDYVPSAMTFLSADNSGWAGSNGASAPTYTISSLSAGASTTIAIVLEVDTGASGDVTNTAEISGATGGTDIDSTPDSVDSDLSVDDEINDDGTLDEDDHDPATFTVGATTYRIGNLIWLDTDADGVADIGEAGIANVAVELWSDDATAGPSASDTLVAVTMTASDGSYAFPGLAAGDYYIVLPDSDDGLDGLTSVTVGEVADPDDDTDNDDNGVNQISIAGGPAGLASGVLTLAAGEPTDEVDRSGSATDSDDDAFTDSRSNYSVDFGFVRLRVGNLVWYDDGAGDTDGDGTAASSEDGIDTVKLQLFEDLDSDGRIDAADPLIGSTTTDTSGNYGFDGVEGGTDYLIGIPAEQTGQGAGAASFDLGDLTSSYGTAAGDNFDHGDPATSFQAVSTTFSITAAAAPTGETDGTTGSDAETIADTLVLAATDTNSDQTIDFGFAEAPVYSIGNLIFDDLDADGIADIGEPGISGLTVELWKDDGDGVADSEDLQINTTTTDGSGNWSFIDLAAGDYYVIVPTGQSPLTGFVVSPNTVTDPDDDADNDNDVTGLVSVSGGPAGYTTGLMTLGEGADSSDEPTDETTRSGSGVDDDPGTTVRDDRTNLTLDLGWYRLSLGNSIWYDTDADGIYDGTESGLNGVTVTLRDGGTNAVVATTTTDVNGHYLFVGLTHNGTYIVEVDAANFATSGALENLISTTGNVAADDDIDDDDSGVDPGSPTSVVQSTVVTLTASGEPTLEADDNDGITADASENLTVDFGFTGLSIGNRVWYDSNNDGDDDSETGVSSVTVNLRDGTTDGLLATTTTDNDGEYLFSGLTAGDYVVEIPASNWLTGGALVATRSVQDTAATDVDGDDDGIDPTNDGDAVRSTTITLAHGTEPTLESPDNGVSTIPDANENLTVDFGFHGLALGNLVWLDSNTVDGLVDSDEFGVGGVSIELHAATGDALLQTATTDSLGRYLFLGLDDGASYVVTIPSSQFADAAPLEGYTSTAGNGEPAPDPDNDTDSDDNGIAGSDVDSLAVTVDAGAEPTNDADSIPDNVEIGPIDDANANLALDFGFVTTTPLGLGSRVWKDLDADGTVNSTNESAAGVAAVTVNLHRDDDGDGVADRATPFATATTDSGGYYLFTGLAAGDWVIELPSDNFAVDAVLEGWHSTSGVVGAGDENDDGIDPATVAGAVFTSTVTLTAGGAPIDESDKPTGGLDWDLLGDDNVDLTYDFGFTTLSIGNRVFYDEDANGIFDVGTDRGIDSVQIELWEDFDLDGTYVLFRSTQTAPGGYYEFGGLANGRYKVVVAATNFSTTGRLDVLESSPGASDANLDVDEVDDGVDPNAWGEAVSTMLIDMSANTEPLGESPDPWGQLVDSNGNLTVDFGFRRQCLIGALAWFDTTDNNVHDIDEFPAAGETAYLVNDATEEIIATNVADQYGWYLFEHLTPGITYRVDFDDPDIDSQYPTCILYC